MSLPALALLAVLSQQPLPPGQRELPPNHPPLGVQSPAADAGAAQAPTPEELLQELDSIGGELKTRDKPFEVAHAMGKLYFKSGRRQEATELLTQAKDKAEPARKLYLDLRKKAFSSKTPPAKDCKDAPKSLDAAVERARTEAKVNLAGALGCLRAALVPAVESETLLGHAYLLWGDKAKALQSYERALEVSDTAEDALFSEGVLLMETQGEDVKALERARVDFDRYVQLYPSGARVERAKALAQRANRAINAGGLSKLQ